MTTQPNSYDQIVYLLQGGGALGSYQVGVCQALLENDCHPDWVVGTSIGAINGAILVGNKPEQRIAKLREFWDRISCPIPGFMEFGDNIFLEKFQNYLYSQWIATYGQPNFFKPRIYNPFFLQDTTPDKISFYDTSELRKTLKKVINFDLINEKKIRLTLGAVKIKGGQAVRFDNFHQEIGPEHIMASCALPPGFPAIKIDGEYYWDGGLSSNTPFAVVLEEKVPQKLLCFIVNLFSYPERVPSSLMDIFKCKKEIEFASRHQEVLHAFCELHYLQHAINTVAKTIKKNHDLDEAVKRIQEIGHPLALNIVQYHYHDKRGNLWSKDFNFSLPAIQEHREAGYKDVIDSLKNIPWRDFNVDENGVVLHEF